MEHILKNNDISIGDYTFVTSNNTNQPTIENVKLPFKNEVIDVNWEKLQSPFTEWKEIKDNNDEMSDNIVFLELYYS